MDSPSSRSESVPDDDSWCASRRRPQNQTKRSANASAVAFSSDRPDDATFPAHSTAPLPQRKPTLPNSSRPGRTGAGHQPVLVQVHGRVMAWEPVRADPEPVLPGFGAWEPYTAMQSRTNSPVGHRNTSTSSEASLTDDLPRTQNTAQTDEPSGRDAPYSFMLATPTAQVKAQMHVKLLSAELSRPSLGHWCWQGLGRSIILAVVAMPTGYVGRCATNLSRDDQVRSPGHMGYHQAAWVPCTGDFIGGPSVYIQPPCLSLPGAGGARFNFQTGVYFRHSSSPVELFAAPPTPIRLPPPRLALTAPEG